MNSFIPKSIKYLRSGYTLDTFKKDLIAGMTVGIIALPLAMAFAIASGVTPDRGLYTAIVAGFLISALGGSRVQIGGPTGAFVVIIYGIIQRTGYSGLCTSTLIAGAILILLALFRLGSWIKYVPHPLITGFTSGIAVLIFSTQMKDFFGLGMGTPPADFIGKWIAYAKAMPTADPMTLIFSASTLSLILLVRKYLPLLPWGIIAIVYATVVSKFLGLPLDTIASKFGEIPHSLPWPKIPVLAYPTQEILFDAVAIAFLGGIESLLSAVIGDKMSGGRHRSNCELLAQGIANIGSIFFGGIPATGAIARTAANAKSGARTPIAGIIHSLTLLMIMLVFAPIVSLVPLAALSAVLMMVAWNMSEADHFVHLFKAPISDIAILITAFLLTVFVDITIAIAFGMVLSCLLSIKDVARSVKEQQPVFVKHEVKRIDPGSFTHRTIPLGVEVYEVQGPLFFGVAHILKDLLSKTGPIKVFILRMHRVDQIDASCIFALQDFAADCKKNGIKLILTGVTPQIDNQLKKFGIEVHLVNQIETALTLATTL